MTALIIKESVVSPRNQLNQLTGKEWIAFTKSWFVENATRRASATLKHPAKFPESLVLKFLRFFTQPHQRQLIVDPFGGVGSTLVAIDQLNAIDHGDRWGVALELNPHYVEITKTRTQQSIIQADMTQFDYTLLPPIDFIITSPPYWMILNRGKGMVSKKRQELGLDLVYSADPLDLGNIDDYALFLDKLTDGFLPLSKQLKQHTYCVVILSNVDVDGRVLPIPYDFAKVLQQKTLLCLKGEKIWCQDNKRLKPYGYPYRYMTNFCHHTCLIFRKESE